MTVAPVVAAPPHVIANPALGTWLLVTDGVVTVRVGKVELGQGILTALAQIAADALGLPVAAVRMRAAHTADGPDEGLTAGSLSVLQAGPALRHVGAVVRALTGGPRGDLTSYVAR
ncbi:MAG: molybdopterin cofactor-binding domain-containing protein, partial [Nocardioides sp.]